MQLLKQLCVAFIGTFLILLPSSLSQQSSWIDYSPEEFQNYGETIRAQPARAYYPRSLTDVTQAVNEARTAGVKIRSVGRGHTFSDMLIGNGFYVIFTENLRGVTLISNEPDGGAIVQILSGTTNHDLRQFCKENNFSYPANTVIDTISLGGIVSSGSYGTGWDVPTVSDYCVEIRIVDWQGNLRTYSISDQDQDAFRAAKMSLGLFGIVYDFKFKLNPMKNVKVVNRKMDIDGLLFGNDGKDFANLFFNHYSARVFWFPFTDTLYVKTMNITDEPVTATDTATTLGTLASYIQSRIGYVTSQLLRRYAWLTPRLWRMQYDQIPESTSVQLLPDAIHFQTFNDEFKWTFLELGWNVSSTDNFKDLAEAFSWVIDYTYEYSERVSRQNPRGMYPLNIALEFHCLGRSDSILSVGAGNDRTCCIEIMSNVGTPNWSQFQREVLVVQLPSSRATRLHWAKVTPDLPNVVSTMRNMYKRQIEHFESIRKRLNVDNPEKPMFANSWLENIILKPF
mmetsp:Transcript_22898/g.31922  ORF Transcript_22898/g.31922 Transcript_22898/m.31922 type:complete len:510 (+) Transcript_22898:87-1616(+)